MNMGPNPGDYLDSRHWKHPRTMREAFGQDLEPLGRRITFLPRVSPSMWSLVIVLSVLLFIITLGALS